jgi:hypothetical protein
MAPGMHMLYIVIRNLLSIFPFCAGAGEDGYLNSASELDISAGELDILQIKAWWLMICGKRPNLLRTSTLLGYN